MARTLLGRSIFSLQQIEMDHALRMASAGVRLDVQHLDAHPPRQRTDCLRPTMTPEDHAAMGAPVNGYSRRYGRLSARLNDPAAINRDQMSQRLLEGHVNDCA